MPTGETSIEIAGERLELLSDRVIYWEKNNSIILSDVHFGKSGHFRKAGIPVPQKIHEDDLLRLERIITRFHAENVFLLGDLFHSRKNNEWNYFSAWLEKFPGTLFHLIKGNHDRWANDFSNHDLKIYDAFFEAGPFCFVHDFNLNKNADRYVFSGHVHPAVYLSGKGHLSASFPCFYFGKKIAILPSFGSFTGQCLITPSSDDRVFVVMNDEVRLISEDGLINSGWDARESWQ